MLSGAFSPDEEQQFAFLKGEDYTLAEIAQRMNRTLRSVQWFSRNFEGVKHTPSLDWPLPMQPVSLKVPETRTKPRKDGSFVSVHYGDVHFPHQDNRALKILYSVIEDVKPNLVVDHGDLLDATQISRHEKDPAHRVTQQEELEMGATHQGIIASLVPEDTELWWILGNHEDRIRRLLWEMQTDPKVAQLMQLKGVQKALTWEELMDTETTGWKVFEKRTMLFDKIILKHGDFVRKWSGFTAKEEYHKYGKTGISGHTHRRGVFEHRDWNGSHAWWEHGCLCDLNPKYVSDPDWQQGFLVVTFNDDKSAFGVEEVRIHEGKAFFRGKEYTG